jgi:hypothetical protein
MKQLFTLLSLIFLGTHGSFSQTYFSEDFEAGAGAWTFYDNNNDGRNWATVNASGLTPLFGSTSIWSQSYVDNVGPLTPDNLAISPAIDLTGASGNVVLQYQYFTQAQYPAEKYSVYVTTSNTPATILDSTPIHTEVATSSTTLVKRALDLSAFIGQTVYVTFRHHDCYDQYWIVMDNIKVRTVTPDDVALQSADVQTYILTNQDTSLNLTISNEGNNDVTSVTVNWNDGTDHIATIPVNIQPGASAVVVHPTPINYATATSHEIEVTVTQVNGNNDPDPSNNSKEASFATISQDGGAKVLIEEGTGTWCGWCPRGTVAMAHMYANYSDKFVGIAVHNGDPMTVAAYDNASGFSGYPSMHVDRTIKDESVTQQLMIDYVTSRSAMANPVAIDVTTELSGSELTVNASATFYSNFPNANFRFAAILIEDDVTGTTSGYAQVNYYAGGGNGPMGGYESLPATVPASQMVYDHVGRALLGGYNGQEGSIPTTITDGQTVNHTFNYTIPSTYRPNRLSVAVLVIDANTGRVVNTNTNQGYLNVNNIVKESAFSIYPNPTTEIVNLQMTQSGEFAVKIYDLTGKEVLSHPATQFIENAILSIPVSSLSEGTYIISVEGEGQSFSKKLVIK